MKTEGNVEIDTYGIAICHGNCSFYYDQEINTLLNSAFSFLFLQISPGADIKFGVLGNSKFQILFDYFDFLMKLRNEKITPQVQIDGIGVLIHLFINKRGELLIYVNDVIYYSTHIHLNSDSCFYLTINDSSSNSTIVATSVDISKITESDNKYIERVGSYYDKLDNLDFNRFFPSYEPNFWNSEQDYACVSDFFVSSVVSYNQVSQIVSQKPLLPLPSLDIQYYFEIIVHNFFILNDSIDFSFGIITPSLFDQKKIQNVGLLQSRSIIFYNYRNDIVQNNSGEQHYLNVRAKYGQPPVTLGFGIGYEQLFFTINGEIIYKTDFNQNEFLNEEKELKLYPYVLIPFRGIEIDFNFGQLPFKFENDMIGMVNGWSIWYPKHEIPFKIGMHPHKHLLNTFLSFGRPIDEPVQLQTKDEVTTDEVKFEVQMLHLEKPELIGVGFSNKDFRPSQMVGWDPKCVGLHSDDGKLFFQTGSGTRDVVPGHFIRTGTTETVYLQGSELSYFIDRDKKSNLCNFPFERYPTVTVKGGVEFIINFGESPFYAFEKDYEGSDSVSLFNKLKVKMVNTLLPLFQLKVGDVIESRDRSFRGTIAGSTKDRLFAYIPTYPGAFPLAENTFLDFQLNYRIVYRNEPLFQRIITNKKEPVVIDISQGQFDKIYPTQFGLSFFIGQISIENNNYYIFRPIEDLFNNSSTVVLSEMPYEIINQSNAKIIPLFQGIGPDKKVPKEDEEENLIDQISFQLFDIFQITKKDKKDSQKVLIVIGTDNNSTNNILCFDGNRFLLIDLNVQAQKQKKIKFLLNPFGFRRERFKMNRSYGFMPTYVGMMRGGRRYPLNYRGSYGSSFEVNRKSVILFPSESGSNLPPLLDFFAKKLNSFFAASMTKNAGNNDDASKNNEIINKNNELGADGWAYTTESNHFNSNLNLMTNQDFCGKTILVDHF